MNSRPILQPGKNCWRIERADQVAFLIDGANYFHCLQQSLANARNQILILSWDIHSGLILDPNKNHDRNSQSLVNILNELVVRHRELTVNILSWDFSLLVSLSREWLPTLKFNWGTNDRIQFRLDNQCAIGASHHQKVVVLDDKLAFSGGLDLTRGRYDDAQHDAFNKTRSLADGDNLPIQPYHDVQIAVTGDAAAALGDLARARWQTATGETLEAPQHTGTGLLAETQSVDLQDVDVAIARTIPAAGDNEAIREVEQLFVDSIAAARHKIYIENQFFTSNTVAQALAKRLAEKDGPEIVINLPLETAGWLSQQSLDVIRVGLIGMLRDADKHNRLAIYYPNIENAANISINLHAKVMIVDDNFVRVGSANLNNRSMTLDTECDVAIEAASADTTTQNVIRNFRLRLLAEHLDCATSDIEQQERDHSMIQSIENLRKQSGRSLLPLEPRLPQADPCLAKDLLLADPEKPLEPDMLLQHFIPEKQARPTGLRITTWTVSIAVIAILSLTWHVNPLVEWLNLNPLPVPLDITQVNTLWLALLLTLLVVAGLIGVPVTVLIACCVIVTGPIVGFGIALAGSTLSAILGYVLGTIVGKDRIIRFSHKHIVQVSRHLARRSIVTMLAVRVIPLAPFTTINLIAGASAIKFREFLIGTVLGILPGMIGMTIIADRIVAAIKSPGWHSYAVLFATTTTILAIGYLLARTLLTQVSTNQKSH